MLTVGQLLSPSHTVGALPSPLQMSVYSGLVSTHGALRMTLPLDECSGPAFLRGVGCELSSGLCGQERHGLGHFSCSVGLQEHLGPLWLIPGPWSHLLRCVLKVVCTERMHFTLWGFVCISGWVESPSCHLED